MIQNKNYRRISSLLLTFFLALFAIPVHVHAQTNSKAVAPKSSPTSQAPAVDISNSVANTYNADSSVQQGMIVQLKDKAPNDVVPLTATSTGKILGIVIPNTNVAIVLSPTTITKQQVLVATTGKFSVLVSNQNGPIKVGDYLSISALAGVAMKAGIGQPQVIGKAAGNFTGTANVLGAINLKDQLGKDTKVAIGRITIDISIAHNPLDQKTVDLLPAFMVNLAQSVANKSVSVARIYVSSVILFVVTIVTAVMLYSGVRSGMIAVGRNPLSKKSIIGSLIQTVFAGLIILIVGVLAVYLILKL
jgi:hypothetical protein